MLERGLEHTPREIAQQPGTWIAARSTVAGAARVNIETSSPSPPACGPAQQRPTVFLVGAGTSDYIGRSLHHLLRTRWQCEVIPVASTSLLTDFRIVFARPTLSVGLIFALGQ